MPFIFTLSLFCIWGLNGSWAGENQPKLTAPYEQCSWKNQSFTQRIVRESQSGLSQTSTAFCITCTNMPPQYLYPVSYQVNRLKTQVLAPTNHIPPMCFLASSLRGRGRGWRPEPTGRSYYYCPSSYSSQTKTSMLFSNCSQVRAARCRLNELGYKEPHIHYRPVYTRKPCLSEDYIRMTAKAFNQTADCFGFTSRSSKNQLFALMNHESAFILNKRAITSHNRRPANTARCYGQIKNGIMIDINKYITYPHQPWGKNNISRLHRYWGEYHNIYRAVVKRCPFLKHKTSLQMQACRRANVSSYISCLKTPGADSALKCQSSQDPYTCLFYTLYNLTINQARVKNILNPSKKKHKIISVFNEKGKMIPHQAARRIQQDFKLPLELNEVLSVTGFATVRGVKRKVSFLLRDAEHASSIFARSYIQYDMKDLKVEKINLFNQDKLKWAFSHLAHNGGHSVINTHLEPFIKELKYKLTSKREVIHNPQYQAYRKQLFSAQSLDLKDLNRQFQDYAQNHKIVNQKEVSVFLDRLNSSLHYLSGKRSLKSMVKNARPDMNRRQINHFLKAVQNSCLSRLY